MANRLAIRCYETSVTLYEIIPAQPLAFFVTGSNDEILTL